MTDSQFSEWFAHHTARFSGHAEVFAKLTADQRRATRDAWSCCLRPVSLEDAKVASDELFESDGRPPFFDRVPATVRAIARRIEEDRRRTESGRRFARSGGTADDSCPRCSGGGQVCVYVAGPDLVAAQRVCNDLDKAMRRTCAVLCDCDAGRRMAQHWHGVRQRMISAGDVVA